MSQILRYIKIYFVLFNNQLKVTMMYRVSFFVQLFVEFGYISGRILFVFILYSQVDSIAGWDENELLFLMGLNTISSELLLGAFAILNLRELPEMIKDGKIDLTLLKPMNSLFSLSLGRPYVSSFISAISGVVFMLIALVHLDIDISLLGLIGGLIVFIFGHVIGYCLLVLASLLSFIFINATTSERLMEVLILSFKINPHNIYQGYVKFVLWFIVPVVFMASIPADMIMHGLNIDYVLISFVLSLAFLIVTVKIWNLAIRSYTSAGG